MASLDDSDADAFFRQGDDGTYSGGPGDSIPAGVVNVFDDLDEDTLPRLTNEQIERRERYKKLVTGLVGALGVSAILAVGIRAVGNHTDDEPKATARVTVPLHAAIAPVALPTPAVEAAPVDRVPSESSVVAASPAAAPIEQVKEAKPAEPSEAPPRWAKAASASRNTERVSRPPVPAIAAARTTPLPSLVHSSPPTAYFPD